MTTPPRGEAMPDGFTVTTAEMYALLQRIDRKVDSLVQTAEGLEERVADHEARLRVLESAGKNKTQPTTIIALLISAAAIITTVLLYTIDR
jgi:hypothetical protein